MIQEAWIGGVSTRRVDELVQAMGLSGISKSTVSKLCKDIDERVRVTDEVSMGTLLIRFKMDQGIPAQAFSCHTGIVDGYALEGHVPAADIRRLLTERPDAVGLAVPDMPYGPPGMGSKGSRDAYDVLLIRRDGGLEVYTSYSAA